MVYLINTRQEGLLKFEDLVTLERTILTQLEFDIQIETVNNFMDRYCQLFYFDEALFKTPQSPSEYRTTTQEVVGLSRYLCKYAIRSTAFLEFLPSHIAAASVMLALNSVKAVEPLCGPFDKSSCQENLSMLDSDDSEALSLLREDPCVLEKWTNEISKLTGISRATDIKPAYCKLIQLLKKQGIEQKILPTNADISTLFPSCDQKYSCSCQ